MEKIKATNTNSQVTDIVNLLACPLCKTSLGYSESKLICKKCNDDFSASEGIFSFINEVIMKRNPYLKEEILSQDRCLEIYTDSKKLIYYFELFDLKHMLTAIHDKKQRILDLGCGIGNLGDFLKGEIWGVDISKTLLLRARGKERYLFQATGEYLPFANDVFDVVFLRSILHHAFFSGKILEEVYRVLKPGGLVISADPRSCLLTKLAHLLRRKSPYYSIMHRSFTFEEYISLFKKKFEAQSIDYSFFIFYLFANFCDIFQLSKIIPFRKKIAFILFSLDGIITSICQPIKRFYFMLHIIAKNKKYEI